MAEIAFQEPMLVDELPSRKGRSGYPWNQVKEFVDAKPGHWVKVRTYEKPKTASQATQQVRKNFGIGYEVCSRGVDLYIRKMKAGVKINKPRKPPTKKSK